MPADLLPLTRPISSPYPLCRAGVIAVLAASLLAGGNQGLRTELAAVRSKDGTRIAYECAGSGAAILFVHGGIGDRTRWTPLFPYFSSRFRVCAMDRRGHGASGDSAEYSLQKEAEDVAAVVTAITGPVFVLGHSYGGVATLEAARLTGRMAKMMLYEPPLYEPPGPSLQEAAKIDGLVNNGKPEDALVTFQRDTVKQSAEEISNMKARPTWAGLVASIAMQPRQMRALAAYRFDEDQVRSIRIPTLLLIGEDSASPYVKQSINALGKSLPNATTVVLKRQQHNAMEGGREMLANEIIAFVLKAQ